MSDSSESLADYIFGARYASTYDDVTVCWPISYSSELLASYIAVAALGELFVPTIDCLKQATHRVTSYTEKHYLFMTTSWHLAARWQYFGYHSGSTADQRCSCSTDTSLLLHKSSLGFLSLHHIMYVSFHWSITSYWRFCKRYGYLGRGKPLRL